VSARVNGNPAEAGQPLRAGDTVELITKSNSKG
jgi:(p)ppGpp synthase/HD superfamily hydrolase